MSDAFPPLNQGAFTRDPVYITPEHYGSDNHPQYLTVARLQSGEGFGGWTDYSGSFAWASTGTAPALGNATVSADYAQIGKTVFYRGTVVFGSTSTFGTGNYSFSLPVTTVAGTVPNFAGAVLGQDTFTAYHTGLAVLSTTTTFQMVVPGAATIWGAGVPFTWANTDAFSWSFIYEAA
jgi:hypothetical protein